MNDEQVEPQEQNKDADYWTRKMEDQNRRDRINALCREVHTANRKWWLDPTTGEPLVLTKDLLIAKHMLIVTEIAEATEGVRKDAMDDKLPHRKMEEVEMADAMIRIFDYCAARNLDLGGAYVDKMAYNATRLDHTLAARLAEGGKKI